MSTADNNSAVLATGTSGPEPLSKRDAIVAAAGHLFLEVGFENTSMDAIAEAANVSKRTVYNHFTGKDVLFGEVMMGWCKALGGPEGPPASDDPADGLATFGRQMLNLVTSPMPVSLLSRLIAGRDQFPDLCQAFWRAGPDRVGGYLTEYLADLDRRGILKVDDPTLAAMQFIGLVIGPFHLRRLLDIGAPPTADEIDSTVDRAVAIFMHGVAR